MKPSFSEICAQLQQSGFRRLLVLSGESEWVSLQLLNIKQQLAGDWCLISPTLPSAIVPEKAHLLLGREFTHAIFDAQAGFHSEAFAILAGALKAGSLLVLCTPPQSIWAQRKDRDSLRWNEQHGIIPTPNFIHHLQHIIRTSAEVLVYQQDQDATPFPLLTSSPKWSPPSGEPTLEQQQALRQLAAAKSGIWGITAPRGRGKSTVAGMLVQQWQGECWCCAPAKVALGTLSKYAGNKLTFWAPDTLLQFCRSGQKVTADWLIIDEASAIPSYILREIITYFPRVLMATTVDGYEGTGRGFIRKFCDSLENFTGLDLNQPMRFASNDPLERFLNQALLLQEPAPVKYENTPIQYQSLTQSQLINRVEQLNAFYGLLASAHYRTSPLDLRRLLDGQGQHFFEARARCGSASTEHCIGALWMVDEGLLEDTLSWRIWAGLRRPRGNLVAQSLAAHSYFPFAAQMKSRRMMRIAIESGFRRQQIGFNLIQLQRNQAEIEKLDFLSVSFGLTPELLAFWQKVGFQLIRIGSHREASSGCFSAMAIMPLTSRAQKLCERGAYLLQRDLFWRADLGEFSLKISQEQDLMDEDWVELFGFSEYSRPIASSLFAIQRLMAAYPVPEGALTRYFHEKLPLEEICQQLGLTGQKQWLKQARAEIYALMQKLQPEHIAEEKQRIKAFYL